jgi:LPLT family lysophospholipid transporter-like MFS transporter
MNKQIYPLLIAQFLSAFADNAILFTVIAMVMQSSNHETWYIPALQSVFLVAPVVLAPWVGVFADEHPKARVLFVANLVKGLGTVLLLLNIEPLIAYCIVGAGAAVYGPAKYGILPELAGDDSLLVKANSWIEGSTILAILSGMMVGAKVADQSIFWALVGTIVMFLLSAVMTLFLPVTQTQHKAAGWRVMQFVHQMERFFTTPRSRFSMLGAALFWATAATLRVIIVAWAPLVLALKNATEISELTLFLAIGIIIGSVVVPHLIPLNRLRRARIAAYFMAAFIVVLSLTENLWPARITLLLIGVMGGMFIVPVNAALQDLGQQSIGSGRAVALQGFFENGVMLLAVGSYTYAAAQDVDPIMSILVLGCLVFIATFWVSINLPDNSVKAVEVLKEPD